MAKQIKRSDVSEKDLYRDIRKSAEDTIGTVESLNKELSETAEVLLKKLKKPLDVTAEGLKEVTENSDKLNEIMKQSLKLDKAKADAIKAKTQADNALAKLQREKIKQDKAENKSKKDLTKSEKEMIRLKEKLNSLRGEEGKEVEKLRQEIAEKRREVKKSIQQDKAKEGSLNALRISLNKARQKYDALSAAERDNTSAGKRLAKQINRLDKEVRELEQSTGRSQRNVGNYASAFKSVGREIMSSIGTFVGVSAAISALSRGVRSGIDIVRNFGQANADLAAVLGVTASETKALQQQQKDLGATTVFSATQIAEAQKELAKLGQTQEQILKTTPGLLSLSAATGEDLATSAEVLAKTLNQFQLDASQSNRVVDVMAKSFSATSLDLEKFNESMKLAAPIANAAGLELEATTALIGELTNAGIQGSLAGTGLRNLLGKLSDGSSALSKSLGFTVNNSESLVRAFKELKERNIDLTEATELTDERSKAAFITLINGVDNVKDLEEAFKNAGGAARTMAETQLNTLEGDIKLLNSAWEAAVLEFSNGGSVLRSLTQSLTSFVLVIKENSEGIKSFLRITSLAVTAFVTYRVAVFSVNKAILLYNKVTKAMAVVTRVMKLGIRGATVAFKGMNKAMKSNIIGLVTSLLATLVAEFLLFRDKTDEATEAQKRFNEAQNELAKQQDDINKRFAARNELSQKGVQDLINDLEDLIAVETKENDTLIATNKRREEEIKTREELLDSVNLSNDAKNTEKDIAEENLTLQSDRIDYERESLIQAQAQLDLSVAQNKEDQEEINQNKQRIKDALADIALRKQQLNQLKELIKVNNQKNDEEKKQLGLIEELEQKLSKARESQKDAVSENEIEKQNLLIEGYQEEIKRLRDLGIEKDKQEDKDDNRLENLLKRQQKTIAELEEFMIKAGKSQDEIQEELKKKRIKQLKEEIKLRKKLNLEVFDQKLELAKLEAELLNKELDSEQAKADALKDKQAQRLEDAIAVQQQLTDAFVELTDRRIAKIDEEIAASERRFSTLQDLAAEGNITAKESLAEEARLLAEQNRKKEQLERRKQRIELASSVLEAYQRNTADESVTNPLAKTITDTVLLTEFIKSLPAFYEGTEDTGKHGEGVDGKGGFFSILHPNERVMPKEFNAMTGNMSNEDLATLAYKYQSGLITDTSDFQGGMAIADNSLVIKELQDLKRTIKNKPETNIELEQIINGAMVVKRTTSQGNTKIYNRYRV
jgi:TP901 family phage tail tape measure protein